MWDTAVYRICGGGRRVRIFFVGCGGGGKGIRSLFEKSSAKTLYCGSRFVGLIWVCEGDFLMGLCADISFVPADKMGAIQILWKGGDGSQGPPRP